MLVTTKSESQSATTKNSKQKNNYSETKPTYLDGDRSGRAQADATRYNAIHYPSIGFGSQLVQLISFSRFCIVFFDLIYWRASLIVILEELKVESHQAFQFVFQSSLEIIQALVYCRTKPLEIGVITICQTTLFSKFPQSLDQI